MSVGKSAWQFFISAIKYVFATSDGFPFFKKVQWESLCYHSKIEEKFKRLSEIEPVLINKSHLLSIYYVLGLCGELCVSSLILLYYPLQQFWEVNIVIITISKDF